MGPTEGLEMVGVQSIATITLVTLMIAVAF